MKRWLIVLLIGIALILLLSPGIIGRLAEKNLDENLSWMQDENDDISIESESYSRGWFTSIGRHRVGLRDNTFTGLLAPDDEHSGAVSPTLIIETRLDHGLVPITSIGREEGSLQPGLASTVSTLQIDRGDGEPVDLPGKIFSHIGLSGDTTFHYLLEPGSEVVGNTSTRWSGADLTITTSPRTRRLTVEGVIEQTSIESYGVKTEIGRVAIDAAQDRSRFTFGEGNLKLDVESVRVESAGSVDVGFGRLVVDARSDLDGSRVDGSTTIELSGLIVPDVGAVDMSLVLNLDGLDAGAIELIASALRTLNNLGRPATEVELSAAYPTLERQFEVLAASGGRVDIQELSLSLPQGDWFSTLSIEVPESDAGESFSWPSILLKTTASAELRIAASLYDYLLQMQPEAANLPAMGIIIRNGDNYEMRAEYASGLITVNGAPLPIPLGMPE